MAAYITEEEKKQQNDLSRCLPDKGPLLCALQYYNAAIV